MEKASLVPLSGPSPQHSVDSHGRGASAVKYTLHEYVLLVSDTKILTERQQPR